METSILPIHAARIGQLTTSPRPDDLLDNLKIELDPSSVDANHLRSAAEQLRTSDIPVAFPTETVYGLGADATRSEAVKGIYKAKQRPSDNPLIVHFGSLKQLRDLLSPPHFTTTNGHTSNSNHAVKHDADPIPEIYRPLIQRFWPGPLTLILPNPPHSPLAPEVTAGLSTFGARMPAHILALALIRLADRPIAAPSANASTKPSPTAAEHVFHDLEGRIATILDGGDCDVGVESTVVDGLCDPPVVLRPGGISIEQLRAVPGWEGTVVGYKNSAEGGEAPRAPGMKYRHYSPKAPVVLFEAGRGPPGTEELSRLLGGEGRLGVVRTKRWVFESGDAERPIRSISSETKAESTSAEVKPAKASGFAGLLQTLDKDIRAKKKALNSFALQIGGETVQVFDVALGSEIADIARGTFSALRELDKHNVGAIIVEGIDDAEGDTAAAVMNRLRKAAEVRVAA